MTDETYALWQKEYENYMHDLMIESHTYGRFRFRIPPTKTNRKVRKLRILPPRQAETPEHSGVHLGRCLDADEAATRQSNKGVE